MIRKLFSFAFLAVALAGLLYYFSRTNGNATNHDPLVQTTAAPVGFVVQNRSRTVDEMVQAGLDEVRSALERRDIRRASGIMTDLKDRLTEMVNNTSSSRDRRFASQGEASARSVMDLLRNILAGHCDSLKSKADFYLANGDHSQPFKLFLNYLKEYRCRNGQPPVSTVRTTSRATTTTIRPATTTGRPVRPGKTPPIIAGRGGAPRMAGLEFVKLKSGSYSFGTPPRAYKMGKYDVRVRKYPVGKGLFISTTEVTQRAYFGYLGGTNSLNPKGPDLPVHSVSYQDATAFCKKLNTLQNKFVFRLPNEAEWEIACRAGQNPDQGPVNTKNRQEFDSLDRGRQSIQRYAFMETNSNFMATKPERVGQKLPNAWGLHDMHGNVAEWCTPLLGEPGYKTDLQNKPIRGGSFNSTYERCRAFSRALERDNKGVSSLGFRLLAEAR